MSKQKYVTIYGVDCRNIHILEVDKWGARFEYQVKYGRKMFRCWLDHATIGNSQVLSDLVREFKDRSA